MNLSTRPHKEGHHEILDEHGNVVGSLWKWPFNEGVALTLHGVCWTRDGMGWTEGELSRQYCFRTTTCQSADRAISKAGYVINALRTKRANAA